MLFIKIDINHIISITLIPLNNSTIRHRAPFHFPSYFILLLSFTLIYHIFLISQKIKQKYTFPFIIKILQKEINEISKMTSPSRIHNRGPSSNNGRSIIIYNTHPATRLKLRILSSTQRDQRSLEHFLCFRLRPQRPLRRICQSSAQYKPEPLYLCTHRVCAHDLLFLSSRAVGCNHALT